MDEAADGLASGALTSRGLIETCLERIEDSAGQGAQVFLHVASEKARASADAMDALRRAGRAPGRYAGIPVSLKDLFDIEGEPTRAASLVLAEAPPARASAGAVQRLLQAGLVPVGRTNMTEFAFSGIGINPHHGTPLSPWRREEGHIPGGSSSGAAVSISDGMAVGAIGTDTGGSCRIPAAFCGVTGFKPTARRVPLAGVVPLSPTLDSVGPLARSVGCCAALDSILAGDAPGLLPAVSLEGLRLGLPMNLVLDGLDEATEDSFDRAINALDRAGAVLHRRRFPALERVAAAQAKGGFAVVEAYAWHRAKLATDGARYDQRIADRIRPGAGMAAADYIVLLQARAEAIAAFAEECRPYDALVMPTVVIAPPPLAALADDRDYWRLNNLILRNTAVVNFLDGCAISLPCHLPGAAPAGLMLVLPGMADRALLAIARAAETALRQGQGLSPWTPLRAGP
jgi:aspartyl-tRNA(Asn)/glutamyl-tRNA(Gln) amidotransferase subunit A